jgi:hypothetical protein
MNRIITSYKKRQDDLSLTAYCVLEKMENNEYFPHPPAALAELKKVLPEFYQARVNAGSRDRVMVSTKDDLKKIVLTLLEELADYVTATCKGNRTMMLSSGFDVTGETGNSNTLPATIEKLEVKLGPPGEATIKVRNVTGARAYMHQYTSEPPNKETIWVSEGSALSSYTFKGLTSDKRYWFRVIAIGSGTQRAYSPVFSVVIQ